MTETKTVQRVNFLQAGYDVIPLKPGTKDPFAKAWQKRPTYAQWNNAPTDSNLGLRAGKGKAFIDCDDKNKAGTFDTVTNWLVGLGYDRDTLPIVQTASGVGRHIYVKFSGALLGSYRKFNSTVGAGEFRYGPASQVATFPDVIAGGGEYKLLQGDIARLPVLDIRDIQTLINIQGITGADPKQNKRPSPLALAIMQGTKPEKYSTDSDGEMALVLSLHNSGFTYDEIKHVFENSDCLGHYANKHKAKSSQEAERWLRMTYQNAVIHSQNESKTRRIIAVWMAQAKAQAWSKVTDKNIFLGHLNTAYKPGRYEYKACVRDLSLFAGVTIKTVSNSNKRLVKTGLLSLVKTGKGMTASEYLLDSAKITQFLSTSREELCKNGTPQTVTNTEKDGTQSAISTHDAFMNGKGRLGRRAGEVYELLMSEALTFKELQARTRTPTRTLRRILGKLRSVKDRKTGEIIEMVLLGGDGAYYGSLVDLDLVSAIYGTYGATGKRRDEYELDRKYNARTLELGTIKNQ